MVPENRRLFKRMTVKENLELGAYLRNDRDGIDEDLERIYEMFPRVKERLEPEGRHALGRRAADGGDGPGAHGAAPGAADGRAVDGSRPGAGPDELRADPADPREGVAIFMVEQNANMALSIADRGWVLQTGRVVLDDTAEALLANEALRSAYLGH